MSDDGLEFNYEDLRYIKIRGRDDKRPLKKWGGYSQDMAEAPHVHTAEAVEKDPHEWWAIVDVEDGDHMPLTTLIFDLDIHKAPDDFDPDAVTTPENAPLTKTQSGGFHVDFIYHGQPGDLSESDFKMTEDLGWDIDIRGSAVQHHVVAPSDIPGVDTPYDLARDTSIPAVTHPSDAASKIRYKGEPLLEYDPETPVRDFDFERPTKPPEEMPACYHAGLELRKANPEDHPNTHKVNVLTALCGLAAGYDPEKVVDHFVNEYAPGPNADLDKTEYQVGHLAKHMEAGRYSPPSISTLRDYGILGEGETCNCSIPYHGDSGGRSLPSNEELAADMLDRTLAKYEPADEDTDVESHHRDLIGRLLAKVSDDAFPEYRERASDVLEVSEPALDTHRPLMQHKLEEGPVMVADGRTWYLSGTPARRHELLNFELDVRSFLEVPNETQKAEIEISPADGDPFRRQIEPKIFNRRQRFDDEVLADRFGLTFDPGPRDDDTVLDDINKYIATRDAPVRRGTHHMGLHGDEWVTPAGSLTADGWTDDPETVYLEREIGLERAVSLPEDSAGYDEEDVATILRRLPRTRDPERLLPVLGWFYAAPLRPLVEEWENENGFNILNITGDTGSGKTTTLRYLWRCFGMGGEPFDATDTWFVLISTFGATNSIPVWHDEYKPTDMSTREVNRFHDALRKTATGSIAQRGNADKTTERYELRAPAVVSGEQQIQPPAERRRSIMTTFRKETTDAGTETRRVYKQLIGSGRVEEGELQIPDDAPEPRNHALAYFRWMAGKDDAALREKWIDARETVWNHRQEWDRSPDLDDMEVQGLRTIVFGWDLYREFADEHGVALSTLPGEEALDAALRHVAEAVGPEGKRKDHLDRFVELLQRAATSDDYLEDGVHYTFVREGKPDEELRIKVSKAYDAVSKYARDHGLDTEDLLDPEAYKSRFKEAAEKEGHYVVCEGKNTPPMNRCVGISTALARTRLDFTRIAFGGSEISELRDSASDTTIEAATDGGAGTRLETETEDVGEVREKVRRRLEKAPAGKDVNPAALAGQINEDPKAVRAALERIREETSLLRADADGFETL